MAEEFEIVNVGGKKGVASEATLDRLVRAIDKDNKSSTSTANKAKEALLNLSQETKKVKKEFEDFSEEIEDTTTIIEDFGSAAKSAGSFLGNTLISGISGLYDSATGLATKLAFGGDRMSDFAAELPLVGGILSSIIENFETTIDEFRDLSQNGASFNNSLIELKASAAAASLPLEAFSSMIKNNSESMLLLGGTVTTGAKEFAQLTKNIRLSDENFFGMGFQMQELNEHVAGYIELQARLGRLQSMSDMELRNGTAEYIKELDLLAKVTGMERKEAERYMQQQATEANIAAMQSKLSGQNLQNFNSGLVFLEKFFPQMSGGFKDLVDGLAQSELGMKITSLAPGIADLMEEVGQGTVPLRELQTRLKDNLPELIKLRDSLGGAGTSALMSQGGFTELFASMHEAVRFLETDLINPELAQDEQDKREKATASMTRFEQVVAQVRSAFTTAFINSGIFDLLADNLGGLTNKFQEAGTFLGETVQSLGDSDTVKDIVYNLRTVFDNILEQFNVILADLINFNFSDALDKITQNTRTVRNIDGTPVTAGTDMVSPQIQDEVNNSKNLFLGIAEGINDLLQITWTDIALGIGMIAGVITAVGAAANFAIPGMTAIAAVFTAVGVAAAGISTVVLGAAVLVEQFGGAVESVTTAVSDLMTAQKQAETTQIKALTEIPAEKLHDAADGVNALKSALSGFSTGVLQGLSTAVGSALGDGLDDKAQFIESISNSGPLLKEAGEGLTAVANATENLDTAALRMYTDAIAELTEALQNLNEELGQDNNGILPGTGTNAGTVIEKMSGSNNTADKLDQLNSLMSQVLITLQQNNKINKDTIKAIRGQGNLLEGN